MWLSRATKVLEKNSCATTNTYNKFVLRSIIISSQELRPERGREREKEVNLREREGEVGWSAKRKLIIVPWIWLSGKIQGLCDDESAGRHYRAGQVSCRRLGRPRGPVSVNSPLHQIKRINFLSSVPNKDELLFVRLHG